MTEKNKLNGGVEALAKAMRQVFSEVIETNNKPVREDMVAMEGRLGERIDTSNEKMEARLNQRIDTSNENVSVQLAEHNKKYGKLLKENSATA